MRDNLISKHAKSFHWASFFLSRNIFNRSSSLYNFCRTLDDIVDENLDLKLKKKNFLKFKSDFENKNFENIIIKDIWLVIEQVDISEKIIHDLFDGVETDLSDKIDLLSKKDLLIYSYRVAGTVGLMMSKILNVKNKKALKGAIDLGIAMQLTNIARDVVEDEKMNRQYIQKNFVSISKTLDMAEIFYSHSFNSIKAIPLRSRFSILVARRIYKKIGYYILKKKNIENYINAGKIYVPIMSKVIETFFSIYDFIKLFFINELYIFNEDNHKLINEEINLNERI